MAKTRGLTVKTIESLQARETRYEAPDAGCAGLYIQVHPSGVKSWCFRYRFAGKSRKLTIGTAYTDKGIEVIKIGAAREVADEARVSVARRIDPIEVESERRKKAAADKAAAENTLKVVAEKYVKLHSNLRTIEQRKKFVLDRLVFPKLGNRPIEGIKRSDITKLLDDVAINSGPVMADRTLATLRGIMSWHATRSDDYIVPIVRGMARTSTKERSRTRTLTDIEIRALWRAGDEGGMFGRYCQFLLLTATRRNESARMRRGEIIGEEWTVPAARYKTKMDHLVPMSNAAIATLGKVARIGKSDLVFTPDGKRPLTGFGSAKEKLDQLMLEQLRKIAAENGDNATDVELVRWTLHDLRRTARTLMSRIGVPAEHAEACLGHVTQGVKGTYDRHKYSAEKKDAFAKLADLVDRIANPASNVVALRSAQTLNAS